MSRMSGRFPSAGSAPALVAGLSFLGLVACETPGPPVPPGLERPVVAPAMLPTPVVMDCPAAWRTVVETDGTTICEPWEGERPSCGPSERLAIGLGCVPLMPCTDAPVGVPADALWVEAGAPPGGDGSRTSPFSTLNDALLASGTTIALLPGVHPLRRNVIGRTIVGACPDTTEIDAGALAPIRLSNVTVRGVRFTAPTLAELEVPFGASLTLESVAIVGVNRLAVFGSLTAREVAFHDVGSAVVAFAESTTTLEHLSVETADRNGIYVGEADLGRATMHATDVVVVRSGAGSPGDAFHVTNATVVLEGVVVEDAQSGIGAAFGPDVTANDVLIRRVGAPSFYVGMGSGTLDDVRVEDAANAVLLTEGTYTATDLVVGHTDYLGLALVAADLTLTRARVSGTSAAGIDVDGTLHAIDVSISDVVGASSATDVTGSGLLVEPGGTAIVERLLVERTEGYGVGARNARLEGSDVTVRDVAAQPGTTSGEGLLATESASLELERVDVARAETVGIVIEESAAILHDVRVVDVQIHDDREASGIVVLGGTAPTSLVLERAYIAHTVRWGLLAHGDATIDVAEIEVIGVASAPCATTTCAGFEAGAAIAMSTGSRGTVRHFFAEEAELAGVLATPNIRLTLSEGHVAHNTYGILTGGGLEVNTGASPGIDVEDDVELEDNELDFASAELTVGVPMLDRPGQP